uniref:Class II, major histocompatibility complex, transactivator n=1 Tax=Myripristis murdjan TaxID=586833 RepID=A0A667W8M2_9TELE
MTYHDLSNCCVSEASPCKESPRPQCQSPPVIDIPRMLPYESVKDYIQQAKAHMLQSQEMEADLSLTSHYVDVQLVERSILRCAKNTNKSLDKELAIVGDAERQKSSLGRSQIFEGPTEAKPKRTVLLLGNASMGKTTLIKKLCHDWSNDCLPQFDFVFLLDGKALSLNEPTFSLQTLLLELSSSAPYCLDPNSVFTQVLAAPKRVLIIFDGFEELRDYEVLLQTQEKDLATSLLKDSKKQIYTVRQLYSAILQRVVLPGCTLLISTRPRGNASQLLRRSDRLLEVCGFTSTDVETYVSQYFTDPALKASAMDRLKNSSYLLSLCWNPGLCRLVCLVIEQSKGSDDLPRTLTGLCRQVLWLKMECECRRAQTCDKLSSLAWEGHKFFSLSLSLPLPLFLFRFLCVILTDFLSLALWFSLYLTFPLSRTVAERTFLPQVLPSPSGPRGRRRPQREELELTQRFAIGLLFPSRTQLQRHLGSDVLSKDTVLAKRVSVTQHLEGHCNADLSPAQILDVYSGGMRLAGHLARKLPEVLTFRGVPLGPPDAFVVRKVLEQAGAEGKRFCLGLEDTGIQIAGLRAMMELSNINTYRACIADVINLWEELGQSGEEGLLEGAVSKFKINPLKATQVCHIEHLAKLVSIHMQRRLSHSVCVPSNVLECIYLFLTHYLKNKIGDRGAEQLAPALKTLPSLHRLSLYSNAISDGGAESLAAVLSHMTSLTDLDVKFNKLTDVGAQSLGASLKNCPWMKSLRMWNECIPYGVFERLQQQDHRILSQ